MSRDELRKKAIALRKQGNSYSDICKAIGSVPKGTLSYWLTHIKMSNSGKEKFLRTQSKKLVKARLASITSKKVIREHHFQALKKSNEHLKRYLSDQNVAKIALALLYLGEGGKHMRSATVMFGNSDPKVITLFLELFAQCYVLDQSKFRCTIQCRADQNLEELKDFWMKITGIPSTQFYLPRIDARTIGKISKKKDYKGVCRLDYFSAAYFHDIISTIDVITGP